MRRFTELYRALDQTTRTGERIAALRAYFESVPSRDAAWGLALLIGRRIRRGVSPGQLRTWVGERTGIPSWLIDESYEAVGDLSETIALLLGSAREQGVAGGNGRDTPLCEVIERFVVPLRDSTDAETRAIIEEAWSRFDDPDELLVFHKLISGAFRMGVARRLVVRALAEIAGVDAALMDHRLLGTWKPAAESYDAIMRGDAGGDAHALPYPFFLASPIEQAPSDLGAMSDWQVEYKWDGTRAQLIRREGPAIIWSRGEEVVTGAYPELVSAGEDLPRGVVLDGEILAWDDSSRSVHEGLRGGPLPFTLLQRRLGRKNVEMSLFPDVPVVLLAYDLLEIDGKDQRELSLMDRRDRLEALIDGCVRGGAIRLSPVLRCGSWDEARALHAGAREIGSEGLMLKRLDSSYQTGRKRGDWWKWKVDPFTIDAVLIAAQPGSGRRAGLFTDYTFGVWDSGVLVPIAKAYSGLTDEEIGRVDAFVRRKSVARHGPVREVSPELVFELAFEGIQKSARHRSGLALRFPRMNRWRHDKPASEADTIETLRALETLVNRVHAP